ncbi:MAG: glycosyltransferase family 2 protein [Methanobacteriota archaeon]|nr:MAG: glycosyltransferase family 2 protein [Euryarchaeota archaeon]
MVKEKPVLTILVPTADRHELLPETLRNIQQEVRRYQVSPTLYVVDNASNPPVQQELCESFGFDLIRFDDRVDIGNSILRTAELAKTDYVWVFGDDDYMCGGALACVYDVLLNHNPDVLYLNHYIATNDMTAIIYSSHKPEVEDVQIMTGAEAARRFTHHPGFISSLIFRPSLLQDGQEIERQFPGYGFLGAIYKNSVDKKFAYYTKPLVIQRRSTVLWKKSWPIYWLITVPEMFKWLEETVSAQGVYQAARREVNVSAWRTLITARALGYGPSDEFWRKSSAHLIARNKLLSCIIRYGLPQWLAFKIYRWGKRS